MNRTRVSFAAGLLALLLPALFHAQTPVQTFEVASVKLRSGDIGSNFPVCEGNNLQLDPGRFSATNATLYSMIMLAYNVRYSCFIVSDQGLLTGGPKWILTDRYDFQARIPAGTPSYTSQQLRDGAAPELQAMLRALLEDRFKVAVHRSMKEVQVYELTVAPDGAKMGKSRAGDPEHYGITLVPDENNEIVVRLEGNKASIDDFVRVIEPVTHTPVLNRTGLKGDYSFDVKFAVLEPFTGSLSRLVGATSPSIYSVFEKQLGLKLTRGKSAVEEWVIDRAEKPAEN